MKKILACILLFVICLPIAYADDLGIQIIGGGSFTEMQSLDFDDIQIGESYEISGFAKITPTGFGYYDSFAQYNHGQVGNNETSGSGAVTSDIVILRPGIGNYYKNMHWEDSGYSADYAWLSVNILNLNHGSSSYLQDAEVKVIYDDDGNEYVFSGWGKQYNADYNQEVYRTDYEESYVSAAVIDSDDEESIGAMYTGQYVFGCLLPSKAINTKSVPLRMEITIGGNKLTYNIRK